MSKFGFEVKEDIGWDYEGLKDNEKPTRKVSSGWIVSLPHQCDDWKIAGDYGEGVTKEEALAALDAFIQEAKEARETLLNSGGSGLVGGSDVR